MEALQKVAGGIGSGLSAVGRGAENAAYYAQLADAAYAGQLPQFLANQSALLQDPTMRERILSDPGLARILGVPVAPTPGAEDINRFAAAIPPGTSAKVPTGGPQLPPLGARGLLEEAETRLLRQPGSAEEAARGALNIGGMTLEQAVAAGATGITRPLRGGGAAKWSVGPHEIPQGWAIQPGPMGSVFAVDPTGQSPSRFLFHVSQQPPGGFDQLAQMLFPGAKDRTDPRFQAWIRQQSGLPPVEKMEETPAAPTTTPGVPSTTTGGPATPAPAPPGSTQALKDSAARAQARPSTQLAYGSLQQAQQAIQTALTIGPRGPTLRLAPARPQPAIVQRQLGLESTAAQAARAALRAIQRHEFSPLTMSGKPIVNIPRVTGPIWGRTIPALAEVPEELFEPQDLFWQATNV